MHRRLGILCLLSIWSVVAKPQDSAVNFAAFSYKLDSIVNTSYLQQSRFYHFARLYQRVSQGVEELIQAGKIEDTAFIREMEGVFGWYYFKNIDSVKSGTISTLAWKLAFDTLQHPNNYATALMLSISAHVTHDLFFALTEIFKKYPPTRSRKREYKVVTNIHNKIFADYVENTLPYLAADKKWERQLLRKLGRQAAQTLYRERMQIWKQAAKASKSEKNYNKYSRKRLKWADKYAQGLYAPKGAIKEGLEIANRLNNLTFEQKAFLINNSRP